MSVCNIPQITSEIKVLLFLVMAFLILSPVQSQEFVIKNSKDKVKVSLEIGRKIVVRVNCMHSKMLNESALDPLMDLELSGVLAMISDSSITIEGIAKEEYYRGSEMDGFHDLSGLYHTQEILLKDIILASREIRGERVKNILQGGGAILYLAAPYRSTNFKDSDNKLQFDEVNGKYLYQMVGAGIVLLTLSKAYSAVFGRKYYKIQDSRAKYLSKEYKKGSLSGQQ